MLGDDVPDGKTTDFKRAVKRKGEVVVFSWAVPVQGIRDAAKQEDDGKQPDEGNVRDDMPFERKRMVPYGAAVLPDSGRARLIVSVVPPVSAPDAWTWRKRPHSYPRKVMPLG